jgi:hypothetical protein
VETCAISVYSEFFIALNNGLRPLFQRGRYSRGSIVKLGNWAYIDKFDITTRSKVTIDSERRIIE